MTIILMFLGMTLLLGLGFVFAFVKTALSGQYDDLETPAHRILLSDSENQK